MLPDAAAVVHNAAAVVDIVAVGWKFVDVQPHCPTSVGDEAAAADAAVGIVVAGDGKTAGAAGAAADDEY